MRKVCKRLHVVDNGRTTIKSLDRRKRRLLTWMPPFAFQGFDQTGFLTANVGSSARVQDDIEVMAGSEDPSTKEPSCSRFLQSLVENTIAE